MDTRNINEVDIWKQIQYDTKIYLEKNPSMTRFLEQFILSQNKFKDALAEILSEKLSTQYLQKKELSRIIHNVYNNNPSILEIALVDLQAFVDRDPACHDHTSALLFYKGYHALQTHRVAHEIWKNQENFLAYYLQNASSEIWGVDIHPAAKIGQGFFIDHATSLVIGETVLIENFVSVLHEVTLGGTGKEQVDRHPKIREGAMIGAGAKVLGNIEIGARSKVGAGSVVLKSTPDNHSVAGVPAKVVGKITEMYPSEVMNQNLK